MTIEVESATTRRAELATRESGQLGLSNLQLDQPSLVERAGRCDYTDACKVWEAHTDYC